MSRLAAILASPWTFRLWLVFIVLSQTGLAGRLADELVLWLFGERPQGSEELLRYLMQKGYHVLLFSVMGLLAATPPGRRGRVTIAAWCIGFSIAGEALQFLAPARSPQLNDAALNVLSALAGWRLARRILPTGSSAAPRSL